jgi:hypothetical protein
MRLRAAVGRREAGQQSRARNCGNYDAFDEEAARAETANRGVVVRHRLSPAADVLTFESEIRHRGAKRLSDC